MPSYGRQGSTDSTMSKASHTSKSSSLSRLGSWLHRSNSIESVGSTVSATNMIVSGGDFCETLSHVTVRADEAIHSHVVAELPPGIVLEVLRQGEEPRRALVRGPNLEGWISVKTKLNEPLVIKRQQQSMVELSEFDVGGHHEVKSLITLRAGESLDSEIVAELKPGTPVTILELGANNRRRAKVVSNTCSGWLSIATKSGELLIGKVTEHRAHNQSKGMFGVSSSKIKALLEAAREGSLEGVMKITEGGTGLLSKFSGRPNLNCTDIRGKTPLIYATAFGNDNVVEYLLSKPEVDVNVIDDTNKNALHHACKRARKMRGEHTSNYDQCTIVTRLINAGAYLEARDHNGCTAMMFAVANGDEAAARALIFANAHLDSKDFEGHTALDYAVQFRHQPIVNLLLSHGAVGAITREDEVQDEGNSKNEPESETKEATEAMEATEATEATEAQGEKEQTSIEGRTTAEIAESVAAGAAAAAAAGNAKPKAKKKAKKKTDADAEEEEGEAKEAKPKKKAKAKAKSKGKAEKRKSATMAAMTAEIAAAAAHDETEACTAEIAVAETPQERVEMDESQVQLKKLQALTSDKTTLASELEKQIEIARSVGVPDAELAEAENQVKQKKEFAFAMDALRKATDSRALNELRPALAKAQELGCPQAEIQKAQKVLEEEEPKEKAREKLKAAQDCVCADQLKAAIKEAEKVGVPSDELVAFRELLKGAESKENAEHALKEAIESKEVQKLRFAIQQGKDVGLDAAQLSEAEELLAIEEPKQQARNELEAALESGDLARMQAAIKTAKELKLESDEYSACEEAVEIELAKAKKLEELKEVMEKLKSIDMTCIEVVSENKEMLSKMIISAKDLGVSEAQLSEFELRRRKLHNTIEDLKGAIRVFCRVRPLSSKEKGQGDTDVTSRPDPMTILLEHNKEKNTFMFDAVFKPGSQEEVFDECKDLVQSAADGYNVTLFAYGQTGAGKTYTMGGTPENPGVSRRTLNEIFRVTEEGSARYNFTVLGSMVELYRQDLVDLLAVAREGRDKVKKLNIRSDKSGAVLLEGLTETQCDNPQQLSDLLETGMSARKTMATSMNAESSRSHLIFMIKVVSINRETQARVQGKILIVDLAGSERLSKSQVTGDGAKEAIEINKSLTALGDVIEGLTKGSKQIPYRNHKLTELMKDALGGSAKTLMFVNCSPALSNADETVNALKWASRAKKITKDVKKNATS